MMDRDWIRLYRALLDHPVFQDPWLLKLFIWCILKANFKPSRFRGETIGVGQFVTGRHRGSEELNVSPSKWVRGMEKLKNDPYTCISTKSDSNRTIVTVLNYRTYQYLRSVDRTAGDTAIGQPVIQRSDTIEERNTIGVSPLRREEGKTGRISNAADAAATIDPALLIWLRWWNDLKNFHLVPVGVNDVEPSEAILAAWKRAQANKALRELLANRDAIEREIRDSRFCRENWFRLEKLLSGKNRDGEYILRKLLDGGFRDRNGGALNRDPKGNLAFLNEYIEEDSRDG